MRASQLMTKPERNRLRAVLREWRVSHRVIEEVLRHGVFGPETIGMSRDDVDLCLGIMVDESRDRELALPFDRRARLDDDAFLAEWETTADPRAQCSCAPTLPKCWSRSRSAWFARWRSRAPTCCS